MIIKEFFSKFKDNSRTNCTFLEFKEFSRTKVIFKDFSRSVRTLIYHVIRIRLKPADSVQCRYEVTVPSAGNSYSLLVHECRLQPRCGAKMLAIKPPEFI